MPSALAFALLGSSFASVSPGQVASLAADLSPATGRTTVSSYPKPAAQLGDRIVFEALGGSLGEELWISDGTADSTRVLVDLCPSYCSSFPSVVESSDGHILFSASPRASEGPQDLYLAEGDPLSVRLLAAGSDWRLSSQHLPPRSTADRAVFSMSGHFGGEHRLVAAGGPSGELQTLAVLPAGSRQTKISVVADRWFILVFGIDFPPELWVSDGTSEGTTSLGNFPIAPALEVELHGGEEFFYFVGQIGGFKQLFRSDGTTAGTFPLTSEASELREIRDIGSEGRSVYFVCESDGLGEEVCGSSESSLPARPLSNFESPESLLLVDSQSQLSVNSFGVFVVAREFDQSASLWKVGSNVDETRRVMEVCASECITSPTWISESQTALVFLAQGPDGHEPWVLSRSSATPQLLVDVCAGACSGAGRLLGSTAGIVLFEGTDSSGETRVWRTRGDAATTFALSSPDEAGPGRVSAGGAVLGNLRGEPIFSASHVRFGVEPWIGGGSSELALLLKDVNTSTQDGSSIAVLGTEPEGGLVFSGVGDSGRGLYRTTGPESTTTRLSDLRSGHHCQTPVQVSTSSATYFSQCTPAELWSLLQGAPAPELLHQFAPEVRFRYSLAHEDQLKVGLTDGNELQLWTSDGTPEGTHLEIRYPSSRQFYSWALSIGSSLVQFEKIQGAGGRLVSVQATGIETIAELPEARGALSAFPAQGALGVFGYTTSAGGIEIVLTDGTAPGTHAALRLEAPFNLVGVGSFHDGIGLLLAGGEYAFELWRLPSDGSSAQLVAALDPLLGPGFCGTRSAGGRFYFHCPTRDGSSQLWVSDGLPGGTIQLVSNRPAVSYAGEGSLELVDETAVFPAWDPIHGLELWKSDETPAGTRFVHDIFPGVESSLPESLVSSGERIYFVADDGVTGRELWTIAPLVQAGCTPSATSLCLENSRFRSEVTWRDFSGQSGRATAVPISEDTGYFWFFDSRNVELIQKAIDGTGFNGHHWIFYGALSNIEYSLTITDSESGATKRYFNPATRFASAGDITAFGPQGAHARTETDGKGTRLVSPLFHVCKEHLNGYGASGSCAPSATRFCILGRFSVEATWRDFAGTAGVAHASNLTDDTGYLWFFDEANVEVVIKAIDGTAFNDHYWIYYGALSNIEYTLTVTDTVTGELRQYRNPLGSFGSFGDIEAFPRE